MIHDFKFVFIKKRGFSNGIKPRPLHPGQPSNHGNDRKWSKRVTKEWGILQTSLPDTIWVRVYEDRMDLIRAVMTGPEVGAAAARVAFG